LHLVPLLNLTLNGIDPNDNIKSMTSSFFIINTISGIYLQENTALEAFENGEERNLTAGLQEWVEEYIQRIFNVFETMSGEGEAQAMAARDKTTFNILCTGVLFVCVKAGPQILGTVVSLIKRFITNHTFANTSSISTICSYVGFANPALARKELLPICISAILEELEHGSGSSRERRSSDMRLNWYASILRELAISIGSEEFLLCKDAILNVLRIGFQKSRSSVTLRILSNILENVLRVLCSIYFRRDAIVDLGQMEHPNNHQAYWHESVDPSTFQLNWHTPTAQELTVAIGIMDELAPNAWSQLETLSSDACTLSKNERAEGINRSLSILKAIVNGTSFLVDDTAPDTAHPHRFRHRIHIGDATQTVLTAAQKASVHSYRSHVAHAIHAFFQAALKVDFDSQIVNDAIQTVTALINERGISRSMFHSMQNGYKMLVSIIKSPRHQKNLPRVTLARRADLYHMKRMLHNALHAPQAEYEPMLVKDLVALATGLFSDIRMHDPVRGR
jgi:proteasome activator subunit 4